MGIFRSINAGDICRQDPRIRSELLSILGMHGDSFSRSWYRALHMPPEGQTWAGWICKGSLLAQHNLTAQPTGAQPNMLLQ